MDVYSGRAGFRRGEDGEVIVAGEVRVDPALHAHLRRAACPRLRGAPGDFLHRQEVRLAPEFSAAGPLENAQNAQDKVHTLV